MNNKNKSSAWLILMTLSLGILVSIFVKPFNTESATTAWNFLTAGNYTYNSALIEVVGGVAKLIQIDQTDNDNSATTGFAAGTDSDTQWDAVNNWLELDGTGLTAGTGNFTSRILNAGTSTAQWTGLAWNPYRPYSKELPNNSATETAYLAGNIGMQNNVLLFHLNESTTNAEEGGTITDSSGNANNGTLYTGSDGLNKSSSTAQFVSSTQFDGGDDYIEVADADSLDMANSFSVSGWVRSLNSTSTPGFFYTTNRLIASKNQAGTGYQLGIDTDNKPYFAFEDIGTNEIWKYDNSIESPSDTTGTNGRLPLGTSLKGDERQTGYPSIIKDGSTYKMWYTGVNSSFAFRIFYATSPDGLTWTKYDNTTSTASDTTGTNGRIPLGTAGKADENHTFGASVMKDGSVYRMWYTGVDSTNDTYYVLSATSSDGLTWTKVNNSIPVSGSDTTGTNGRIPLGTAGKGDEGSTAYASVIKDGSTYKMWYTGWTNTACHGDWGGWAIFYATSSDALTWTKVNNTTESCSDTTGTNGRLPLGTSATGDGGYAFYSRVVKDGSTYKMWYQGHDYATWDGKGIYYATSPDGLTWTKYDNTVQSVSNTTGTNGRLPSGVNGSGDDYRDFGYHTVLKDGSTYKIWYTASDAGTNYRIYYATLETGVTSTNAISTTNWTHLTGVVDGTSVKLYVNGILDVSTTTAVTGVNNSGNLRVGDFFDGAIDELAVFKRVLTATEILDIYKRGALRLKYQVRSCDDALCSGETFIGPNGTATDYYEEADSNVTTTPSLTLTNLANNQYFQYKAFFDTSSTTLNVELKSVTTTPNHYDGYDPTIVNSATAPSYTILSGFTETLGSSNEGSIRYQLSPDNVYWHYWAGSSWASSTLGYDNANTSSAVNTNIASFDTEIGTGSLYYKAYFRSVSSSEQVELSQVTIATDPTIAFTNASASLSEEGGNSATIEITLSDAGGVDTTVDYTISGSAVSGSDYSGLSNGTATVSAGNTTTNLSVIINDDVSPERDETIIINLSNPTNATVGINSQYTLTITNTDIGGSGFSFLTPAPPPTPPTPLPDIPCALTENKAYKLPSSPGVYYITEDCTKRPFKNSLVFFSYFNSWSDVTIIDAETLNSIPDDVITFMPWGAKYNPKDGALIKSITNPKVFLLMGTNKYWITTGVLFEALGYAWSWIEDVSNSLLNKYIGGADITSIATRPDNVLIKYKDSPKIYLLEIDSNNPGTKLKRHIKNMEVLGGLGFRKDRIVTIPDSEVYEDGVEIE